MIMKKLNLNCFQSKNGNFIAVKKLVIFEASKEATNDYHYYWFNADGAFLRPALYSEWEYATSWGTPLVMNFECPIQTWTREKSIVGVGAKQWLNCASDSMGYRLFEINEPRLVILEKLIETGEFGFGGSFFRCGNTHLDGLTKWEISEVAQILEWVIGFDPQDHAIDEKDTILALLRQELRIIESGAWGPHDKARFERMIARIQDNLETKPQTLPVEEQDEDDYSGPDADQGVNVDDYIDDGSR